MNTNLRIPYLAFVAILVIIVANLFVLYKLDKQTADSGKQIIIIEKAISRAAIACYALEGSYPNQLSYLEDNYGISYDHERYFVHYRYEGANVFPQIIVFSNFGPATTGSE